VPKVWLVRQQIMLGTYALSASCAYYQKLKSANALLRRDYIRSARWLLTWSGHGTRGFRLGETSDPLEMYRKISLHLPPSLAGLPALEPGNDQRRRLPLGLQLAMLRSPETLFSNLPRVIKDAVSIVDKRPATLLTLVASRSSQTPIPPGYVLGPWRNAKRGSACSERTPHQLSLASSMAKPMLAVTF
jgi:hypothetical protein